jgi:hypothetical protein
MSFGHEHRRVDGLARLLGQPLDDLVEVLLVVAGELGDHLEQLLVAGLAACLQAGAHHRVDRGPPSLVGEDRGREQRVVDVEEDRVERASHAPTELRAGSARR